MLLIDGKNRLHINEAARAKLKQLWREAYQHNLELLIPQMADKLNAGYLFTTGVKVMAGGKQGSGDAS